MHANANQRRPEHDIVVGRARAALLALIASLGPAGAACAETVVLPAAKDNTLYEDAAGALSNGAGAHSFVGRTDQASGSVRRGLIAFDVAAAIPAGSTVTGATLRLHMSRTSAAAGARSIALRRATADWGEGSSNDNAQEGNGAAATAGDATWLHRFQPATMWTLAGGDFSAATSASTSVDAIGFYEWSGGAVAADVQAWIDDPGSNFGWVVLGDESTTKTAKRFDTREESTPALRPLLTVVFTPGAQSGACCNANGSCSLLTAIACTAPGSSYQGNGSSCTPNQCPQPTGACCAPDGSCSVSNEPACGLAGGAFQGPGSSCLPNACPQAVGACCVPGEPGSCASLGAIACGIAGGTFQGIGSDCQVDLCPYVDALPRPAVAVPVSGSAGAAASYEMRVQQIQQKLHRDLPPTTLWGYGGSYPGPSIEARTGQPVSVTWVNDLRDGNGALRTAHLLPVDTCLGGPDVEGPTARIVSHLHGGHTPWTSDGHPLQTILPGESQTFTYPNLQVPGTLWYHDHALGITRLNVYLGLAGFYLLRDPLEQALPLPAGSHEVALALQDRRIGADGALQYPALWQEEALGNLILVNGKVWPYLEVDRGWYRFRLLNGSNGRTFTLALSHGLSFAVIGTEGGLLPAPVALSSLTLGPGERADVVVDFGGLAPGTAVLLSNSAPAPYPGTAGVGVVPRVMQFRVGATAGHATPPPAALRALPPLSEASSVATRTLELRKVPSACGDGAAWSINGLAFHDDVTEFPLLGSVEVWQFVNRSGMSHPMHMHLSMFRILDRQPFALVGGVVTPTGPRVPPPAHEDGWKDTVMVGPAEIVRVIVPFEDYSGLYQYHCHMLEHEDHDMMRQFEVRPVLVFGDGFEQ